ncbi:alpha/beta hydrolase [Streptomyces apocyni]|uniref:alpha/beta hydrolase n=1 Tax=Streptomyces apocyni TaxID=2654677 RepID=UPI0012EAE705|nr:alpha/beta fold hydrolase [Streptomyces apocyni]
MPTPPPPANRPRTAVLGMALLLALAATTLTACGDDQPTDLPTQNLSWKSCPDPDSAQGGGEAPSPLPDGGEWQCATMKAPLDWDEPEGDTIGIALIRAEAVGEQNRIGSLIFNFGGPGGSGVATLPAFAEGYETLRTRYDLVSFDPRGVGRSAPVTCEDEERLDELNQEDSTPDTPAEERTLVEITQTFGAACEQNSGEVLPHVRTTDAARDLELLRQVLGDDALHYFGISYGTELGGVYARLFPEKVGRAVFDAVVDPTLTPEEGSLGQAKGFQLALENYAKDCTSKVEDCPVGDTPQEVQDRIAELLRDLDANPLPGSGERELTQTAATGGIAQSLYSQDFWEYLTEGLLEAYAGSGQILMSLSDAMNGRNPDGTYSNIQAANTAINCADAKPRYSVADVKAKLPEFREASPIFGDYLAWGMLGCRDWPVEGAADHPDVSAGGSAPILVIGNTGDPATPYAGAKRMVEALGEGVGVELTYKGEGHGAYDSGNACVQKAVNGYLLDGETPSSGTVCS